MRIILEKKLSDEEKMEIFKEVQEFSKLLNEHLRTMPASSPMTMATSLLPTGCFFLFKIFEDNDGLDLAVPSICAQVSSFLKMYKELEEKDEN